MACAVGGFLVVLVPHTYGRVPIMICVMGRGIDFSLEFSLTGYFVSYVNIFREADTLWLRRVSDSVSMLFWARAQMISRHLHLYLKRVMLFIGLIGAGPEVERPS